MPQHQREADEDGTLNHPDRDRRGDNGAAELLELHQIGPEDVHKIGAEGDVCDVGDLRHDVIGALGIFCLVKEGVEQVHVHVLAIVQGVAAGKIHDEDKGVTREFLCPAGGGLQHEAVEDLGHQADNQKDKQHVAEQLFHLDETFIEGVELLHKITIHRS